MGERKWKTGRPAIPRYPKSKNEHHKKMNFGEKYFQLLQKFDLD